MTTATGPSPTVTLGGTATMAAPKPKVTTFYVTENGKRLLVIPLNHQGQAVEITDQSALNSTKANAITLLKELNQNFKEDLQTANQLFVSTKEVRVVQGESTKALKLSSIADDTKKASLLAARQAFTSSYKNKFQPVGAKRNLQEMYATPEEATTRNSIKRLKNSSIADFTTEDLTNTLAKIAINKKWADNHTHLLPAISSASAVDSITIPNLTTLKQNNGLVLIPIVSTTKTKKHTTALIMDMQKQEFYFYDPKGTSLHDNPTELAIANKLHKKFFHPDKRFYNMPALAFESNLSKHQFKEEGSSAYVLHFLTELAVKPHTGRANTLPTWIEHLTTSTDENTPSKKLLTGANDVSENFIKDKMKDFGTIVKTQFEAELDS